MYNKTRSLDDLETGIKQLLREDRCSFSDEDKMLMNECLMVIQEAKRKKSLDTVIKVLDMLSRMFISGQHLQDLF